MDYHSRKDGRNERKEKQDPCGRGRRTRYVRDHEVCDRIQNRRRVGRDIRESRLVLNGGVKLPETQVNQDEHQMKNAVSRVF